MSAASKGGRNVPAPPRTAEQRLREDGEIDFNSPVEVMRFALVYRGPLVSQGKESRADEKHDIRRHLNLQLWDLWRSKRALSGEFEQWQAYIKERVAGGESPAEAKHEWERERLVGSSTRKHWLRSVEVGKFQF